MPRDWNASEYDRLPIPMTRWGLAVLDRLSLDGDERVLDAGCGTGQVTEALRERLPRGHVVALDASPSMIRQARARLGDERVDFVVADLTEPLPIAPVDAILSTATFHWVHDHERLFTNLAAILRRGGRLVAQCGGSGNIARVNEAAAALGYDIVATKRYATPEETTERLRESGFASVSCWLQPEPTVLPSEELRPYLRTVILGGAIEGMAEEEAAAFVDGVAERLGEPLIDYVRLNIDARRA